MTTFAAGRPFARITRVETHMLRLPLERPIVGPFGRLDARPNLLVRVVLDSGVEGIGEIWAQFPAMGMPGTHRDCPKRPGSTAGWRGSGRSAPPLCTDASRLRLLANQWGAPGPVHQAVAGLDIAIWDAHARSLGFRSPTPCGVTNRPDRVPVYASGIAPPHIAQTIESARRLGHSRFKVRLSFGAAADKELSQPRGVLREPTLSWPTPTRP